MGLGDPGELIRLAWDRLHLLPGGTRAFSAIIGRAAPYTGSVGAHVVELRHGYCKVQLPDRPRVRNHLRSIHAIALCNLAEITGNVMMAYGMPDRCRFIVAGISIDYLKKARGTITGECRCEPPTTNERREYEVPVVMRDRQGDVVAEATLRTLIGPS